MTANLTFSGLIIKGNEGKRRIQKPVKHNMKLNINHCR